MILCGGNCQRRQRPEFQALEIEYVIKSHESLINRACPQDIARVFCQKAPKFRCGSYESSAKAKLFKAFLKGCVSIRRG
ncbi:hypothetical protein Naga_100006g6 [Nannochloropsis gaditana]|uniref:Uncharacterized protein n=1 Tax=Nannochloropsis gaditana TaxID=72520 RepID=W7U9E8_9STRA|nr:hypothetical protein Naga_100006g6 [Nannochloropsis gaditana]